MNYYSPEYYKALDADYIIERENDTFLCYRKRESYTRSEFPLDKSNWKIARYSKHKKNVQETNTSLLYPYGDDGYNYSPLQIDNYEWRFAL